MGFPNTEFRDPEIKDPEFEDPEFEDPGIQDPRISRLDNYLQMLIHLDLMKFAAYASFADLLISL